MDATTRRLADYALATDYARLPASTVHECKRRLIDTFACAVGAFDEPVAAMARAVAKRQGGDPDAGVWGCDWRSTPEAAAFANGVMLRFLDISDTYRVKSGGHPSDVIAGVLAVADAVHADGRETINAITLAYEIYCSFCEVHDFNTAGWDQPVYGVIGTALGAGRLLGLDRTQMENAVALAAAPNLALFQTRVGELSAWKGCAGGNASRNGVFAAMLARDGFTGPNEVFEGKAGVWDATGRFDWQPFPDGDTRHHIERTDIKCFPVCYHGQSAVWAAVELHDKVSVPAIERIEIETYRQAVGMMGSDPTRWAPDTRETADHSLPYVVALGLVDGEINAASFADARLRDPVLAALMKKTEVRESAELSAQHPEGAPCRITVHDRAGQTMRADVKYPRGHRRSPLPDADVDTKFRSMFRGFGDAKQCETVLKSLRTFEEAADVRSVLALLTRKGS